jgi:hypothetical protein
MRHLDVSMLLHVSWDCGLITEAGLSVSAKHLALIHALNLWFCCWFAVDGCESRGGAHRILVALVSVAELTRLDDCRGVGCVGDSRYTGHYDSVRFTHSGRTQRGELFTVDGRGCDCFR